MEITKEAQVEARIDREPKVTVRRFVKVALKSTIDAFVAESMGDDLAAATKCLEDCYVVLWGPLP